MYLVPVLFTFYVQGVPKLKKKSFRRQKVKENLSIFFPWYLPVVKISPEWVTGPEQSKSSGKIATFSLWTGMFRDGISS
jgi:hypothetical protein